MAPAVTARLQGVVEEGEVSFCHMQLSSSTLNLKWPAMNDDISETWKWNNFGQERSRKEMWWDDDVHVTVVHWNTTKQNIKIRYLDHCNITLHSWMKFLASSVNWPFVDVLISILLMLCEFLILAPSFCFMTLTVQTTMSSQLVNAALNWFHFFLGWSKIILHDFILLHQDNWFLMLRWMIFVFETVAVPYKILLAFNLVHGTFFKIL